MTPHTLNARLTYARHSLADGHSPDVALLDLSQTIKGHRTMTQHTHTPGPWRVKKDQGELQVWRHEPNENPITRIAAVCRQPFPIDHGDHVANAHLIAAAPDLLAALQELEILTRSAFPHGGAVWQAQQQARAAIAKATGTNPANIP